VNTTILEEGNIGYLYVGSFDTSRVEAYYPKVLDFYTQIEDYNYLIIDVRGNTGGFYSVWIDGIVRPLIKETVLHEQFFAYRTGEIITNLFSNFLNERVSKNLFSYLPSEVSTKDFEIYRNYMTFQPIGEVDFQGQIIVLVDNMVYSAAEGFANFCREENFATIYGTATGGDGIILYPMYFVLPNSKLVVEFASAIGLDGNGYANEEVRTQPDVYYESEFGNFDELINFVVDNVTR
jgi:C-terminal processing protease CtpA/Prc